VLKKLFKALTTLTLLVGCYFGYVHVFAIVVEQLQAIKHTDNFVFAVHDSKSKQESIRYAKEACGENHWAADEDLDYRYYNAERGYWIYAKVYERVVEENGVRYDGKRIRLAPFLLITKSRDGKNTKTITSDRAIFDLSEPLGFNASASGEPLKIKHAHLEPNVVVTDDKGTPHNPADDMKIGPLTTVDYEETTQKITTEADTYVVMRDPDMTTTGYGMVMQLRKNDPLEAGGPSSGFQGVERLDLLKNVNVIIRDVGSSGILSGPAPARKPMPQKDQARIDIANNPGGKTRPTAEPVEPIPLHLSCDSMMQVFMPKPKLPVMVGPPAPAAPTLAKFHRNVVVLRGKEDNGPDQLTCDTLDLNLVPGEKPTEKETPAVTPDQKLAQAGKDVVTDDGPSAKEAADSKTASDGNQGLFGGLILQRVHATGHAVWLILPKQGVKLRCNQMIHLRQLPFNPDKTYFRGDRTRPVEIVKVDVVEDEGPDQGKITSVTNIWTVDATLFDSGAGMDAADVVAHGPGRLETRPDRDQPVERIAIWQDKLIVVNKLGPDNQILHKIIDLIGNRPCFIDNLQKTSIDSASWIQVWLKPKPAPPVAPQSDSASSGLVGDAVKGQNGKAPVALASVSQPIRSPADGGLSKSKDSGPKAGMGGGNLQMEQLHAIVDVHLLAPAKTMTARERLDAVFIDAEPTSIASTTPEKAEDTTSSVPGAPSAAEIAAPEQVKGESSEQLTAQDEAEKPADEPPMIGSCDRMWARVALKPKSGSASVSSKQTGHTKTASTKPKAGETDAEIRKVWMWGNVALHQDPKKDPDKDKVENTPANKGTDASGEAIYVDNRGTNKAITYVYQRDPSEKTHLPGPLPPARVASIENNDIKEITAAGSIKMNQETDQAWVFGPGTLTQLAPRGFLTDKAPGADEADENAQERNVDPQPTSPDSNVKIRTTAMVQNDISDESTTSKDTAADAKPKTRAGVLMSEKVPMTIGFSESMEFTGRSVDPEQRPAARADFHGIVTAQMEDALLHCTKKMIAFTDREVPLTKLGTMTQDKSQSKGDGDVANKNGEAEPQAELALIYCYRKAVGISRKVDPELPVPIQQQRIEADDVLAYDRRTGDFFVPGKGIVYLYDRNAKSSQTSAPDPNDDRDDNRMVDSDLRPTVNERTVTPTSGRVSNRGRENTSAESTGVQGPSRFNSPQVSEETKASDVPTMVLTQIHFNKGMRGRFGSGKENDKTDHRWSEFYGNVDAFRATVPNAQTMLNPDRLPKDGVLCLTGQTLRVIQEPPPVGSPESTPARQYLKAWENAYASSNENGLLKVLQGDVITYDSYKDLVYAYGEEGHSVVYAQQHAAGQPATRGSAKAVQLNPKNGGMHFVDSDSIGLIDKKTGYRPTAATPDDPYAKKKKSVKKPFRLPPMNIERRGWTGT
jgi:hypothetical protein